MLSLYHGLGYQVFSIGGYIRPGSPHDPKRAALPHIPEYPELIEAVDSLGTDDNLGAAQTHIPDKILEWLGDDGILQYHHYLGERLFPQWGHLREWRQGGGRVIWRTVGQSVEGNERQALPYREDGLEVVRYSPKESNIPGYVGEDALIRFYKDENEWLGWTGERAVVTNVTQDLIRRAKWCNLDYYLAATGGLPTEPAGPGSEELPGGRGALPFEEMRTLLREARCYLYSGTQPASYTLGLIEALMTGTPVVSIGPAHMTFFPYSDQLFEGHELAPLWDNDPEGARKSLWGLLQEPEIARAVSRAQQIAAVKEFGMVAVGKAWRKYLGAP
jgi:hypothetical protein